MVDDLAPTELADVLPNEEDPNWMEEASKDQKLAFKKVVEVDSRDRTSDVQSDKDFKQLMVRDEILEALQQNGYRKPSTVQSQAIPMALLGMDILVQSKTGTGKTLIFAILAAEKLLSAYPSFIPQILVVSPTREIAQQNYTVLKAICPNRFTVGLFVGGVPIQKDRKVLINGCQIAVGTCGRLTHLIDSKMLKTNKITTFILDEADKLMEESFAGNINYMFSSFPSEQVQVLVFSATYPHDLDATLCEYMRDPALIRVLGDAPEIGIQQKPSSSSQSLRQKTAEIPADLERLMLGDLLDSTFYTEEDEEDELRGPLLQLQGSSHAQDIARRHRRAGPLGDYGMGGRRDVNGLPLCSHCAGGHLTSQCPKKVEPCFSCDKFGHVIENCPLGHPGDVCTNCGQPFTWTHRDARGHKILLSGHYANKCPHPTSEPSMLRDWREQHQ